MNKKIIDEAHEIFALAQLMPDEGINDAVERIAEKLETLAQQRLSAEANASTLPNGNVR